MSLVAYIARTKTYAITNNATKASHFVVLRYSETWTLRPYALVGTDRFVIPTNDLLKGSTQIVEMDRKAHPDWIYKI